MTASQRVKGRSAALEADFYKLLDTLDAYRTTVEELLEDEERSDSPRPQLVHRLRQLHGWSGEVAAILEDDALTKLLPMLDRLFALERAEAGTDI